MPAVDPPAGRRPSGSKFSGATELRRPVWRDRVRTKTSELRKRVSLSEHRNRRIREPHCEGNRQEGDDRHLKRHTRRRPAQGRLRFLLPHQPTAPSFIEADQHNHSRSLRVVERDLDVLSVLRGPVYKPATRRNLTREGGATARRPLVPRRTTWNPDSTLARRWQVTRRNPKRRRGAAAWGCWRPPGHNDGARAGGQKK